MNGTKKAPGSAATLTGAAGRKSGETAPMSHSTTPPTNRQAIYRSLRAIAFELNRVAALIQIAESEVGGDD